MPFENSDLGRIEPQGLACVPEPVKDHMGYALYIAQRGGKHRDTKTLSGFGWAGVVEVVKDFRGDTFRAVYTLRYAGAAYCPSRFPKEIEDWTRDGAPGPGAGEATAACG